MGLIGLIGVESTGGSSVFLPGLLVCVVKTSLEKKVFRPGGAARVAQEVENEHTETVNAMPNNKIRHGGPDA